LVASEVTTLWRFTDMLIIIIIIIIIIKILRRRGQVTYFHSYFGEHARILTLERSRVQAPVRFVIIKNRECHAAHAVGIRKKMTVK